MSIVIIFLQHGLLVNRTPCGARVLPQTRACAHNKKIKEVSMRCNASAWSCARVHACVQVNARVPVAAECSRGVNASGARRARAEAAGKRRNPCNGGARACGTGGWKAGSRAAVSLGGQTLRPAARDSLAVGMELFLFSLHAHKRGCT